MPMSGFSPLRKFDPARRAGAACLLALLAQFVLMSLHARSRASGQSLPRTAVMTALYPFQKIIAFAFSSVSGTWSGYFDLRRAHEESLRLKRENAELQAQLLARDEEIRESRRLQALLDMKRTLPSAAVAARVIAGDGTPWFRYVTIDKGALSGVAPNSPVVTPEGVVGRVVEVGPASALVQVITDGSAGLGVMLEGSRANGEVRGGRQEGLCQLDSISGLNAVNEGEAVLTSGLDGVYPKGLLVGRVAQVQLGSGAALHQILVRPAAPIDRLEEVLVIPPRTRQKTDAGK
jgi:rod shape-determining protein MreC